MRLFLPFIKYNRNLGLCRYGLNVNSVLQRTLEQYRCSYGTTVELTRYKIGDINANLLMDLGPEINDIEKINSIIEELQRTNRPYLRFPEFMDEAHLKSLYNLETRSQRYSFLKFLFKREKIALRESLEKEQKKRERELKAREREEKLKEFEATSDNALEYRLGRNALCVQIREKSILKYYNKRLANAVLFGEKIVLDLAYDPYMTPKEIAACTAQLKIVYSENRKSCNPYDLYFCNANTSFGCVQRLKKEIVNINSSFLSLTESSYSDVFDKEKLVYLSPHADETLKEYDHYAIYIIGAFVDTVKRQPISHEKSVSEGIKSYRLPLDEYVMWGAGTKSLTINQVFEIMLILKNTGDWKKAFEVVPQRKIRKLELEESKLVSASNKRFLLKHPPNKALN